MSTALALKPGLRERRLYTPRGDEITHVVYSLPPVRGRAHTCAHRHYARACIYLAGSSGRAAWLSGPADSPPPFTDAFLWHKTVCACTILPRDKCVGMSVGSHNLGKPGFLPPRASLFSPCLALFLLVSLGAHEKSRFDTTIYANYANMGKIKKRGWYIRTRRVCERPQFRRTPASLRPYSEFFFCYYCIPGIALCCPVSHRLFSPPCP